MRQPQAPSGNLPFAPRDSTHAAVPDQVQDSDGDAVAAGADTRRRVRDYPVLETDDGIREHLVSRWETSAALSEVRREMGTE
ncbi:MAG: hypothetical protein WA991_13090 [Ornithinimicrobium sp.]